MLHDPWFNKGTGFPIVERERLGLRGLLPPRPLPMDAQVCAVNMFTCPLPTHTCMRPGGGVNVVCTHTYRIYTQTVQVARIMDDMRSPRELIPPEDVK